MKQIIADERGRITLGSKYIEEYGTKFAIIPKQNKIVLLPIPKDPLKSLQDAGKRAGLDKYSIKELKLMIRDQAKKEL